MIPQRKNEVVGVISALNDQNKMDPVVFIKVSFFFEYLTNRMKSLLLQDYFHKSNLEPTSPTEGAPLNISVLNN